MTQLLTEQLDEIVRTSANRPALECESQLRVAAAMLSQAAPDGITATTVVGVLGLDDLHAFTALVAEIANKDDLDARIRLHVGSFSVRFSRRTGSH
jgi:hypothetical protein